jgi:hypothetical protein
MAKADHLRSMVTSAGMAALAIILPVVFHMIGLGSNFLPMLLPLLLNAFVSSTGWAVLTAALVPWISAFATGMPPIYPPVALVMSAEACCMAFVAGIVYRLGRRRVWPALIVAIVTDRMVSFLLTLALSSRFGLPARAVAVGAFIHGLPGVALQLTVIPIVLKGLAERRSVLFGQHDGE